MNASIACASFVLPLLNPVFRPAPLAQEARAATQAEPAQAPTGDALVLYSAGLDAILTDPRDDGLRRALRLADGRLVELAEELDDFDLPPDTLRLVLELLSSPMQLRIGVHDPAGGLPVSAELHVEGTSAEQALGMAQRVEALLSLALPVPLAPVADAPGLKVLETPVAGVQLGARDGSQRFEVTLGTPGPAAFDPAKLGLGGGARPALALHLDLGPLQGPVEMMLAGLDAEEAQRARAQLELLGLGTDHALSLDAAWGAGQLVALYRNWVPMMEGLGGSGVRTLSAEEIRLVPADATLASVSSYDWSGALSYLRPMENGEEELDQVLAELSSEVGLDLQGALDQLGDLVGYYFSDTTGGGGLASAVSFFGLSDSTGMLGTLEQLAARLDALADERVEGRMRLRRFQHGSARCFSATFPGLPIPFEPSVAVQGDLLFAAATPQGLVAALDHAQGGAPGLASAPGVRASRLADLEGAFSIYFSDTERQLRDGYGIASMLLSALANAVRSPADAGREPGLVMPGYLELRRGARAQLTVARVIGRDLRMDGDGDPSLVATLTAAIPGPVTWGLGAALGITAMMIPGRVIQGPPPEVPATAPAVDEEPEAQR